MNRLVLGTVQFGLKYGINNQLGKPSIKKSLEMLDFAFENGIDTFDTAHSYGDAEEILGLFISKNRLKNKAKIISKLRPNILDDKIHDSLHNVIKWEIEKSLKKLNIDFLDGFLLHTSAYIYNEEIVSAFKKCKKEGLMKNFGVSIYEEKEAIYAIEKAGVDYIQVPYSIFDQRLDKTNFFEAAKKNKTKVFGRSAFLQGLILMDDNVPKGLSEAKKYLKVFDSIIKKYGYSRQEAALLFSLSHEGIDGVVFGVDSKEQLKEDIEIAQRGINEFLPCHEELKHNFKNLKHNIIFPSLWEKNK